MHARIRTLVAIALPAAALAVLPAGCEKPNLEATGGGYAASAEESPPADTTR